MVERVGLNLPAQVRDAGNLLTRAGLSIPAVDVDDLVVRYSTPMELIAHLRVREPMHSATFVYIMVNMKLQ